jgi:hypothetical protein
MARSGFFVDDPGRRGRGAEAMFEIIRALCEKVRAAAALIGQHA